MDCYCHQFFEQGIVLEGEAELGSLMRISRQQRRAAERLKEKRRVADAKARALASRRVAAVSAWRRRHDYTGWQKVGIAFELLFVFLGGPFVALFYNAGWWLHKPRVEKQD
jgi:hypothetical protein